MSTQDIFVEHVEQHMEPSVSWASSTCYGLGVVLLASRASWVLGAAAKAPWSTRVRASLMAKMSRL